MKRLSLAVLGISLLANVGHADHMVLAGLDGDVTTNEYKSFIAKINTLPPPPSNNIDTVMVYERVGGATLHGLQTFYSFTKDRRVLDLAVVWADAFLKGRNDPVNGRVVWTGKRELCWPNKATNDAEHALYSGAENGDVIEHIVATAKLILEELSLGEQTAPADPNGFGMTYLERAKTYVRECQRSAETTLVPWYVRNTKDGYRLIHPDSPVYWKYCASKGPVPWNQQQCIVGGLLRLAQCHRLLNDGNTNIAYYEKITGDAANWFFSNAKLVSVKGWNCYDWGYLAVNDPEEHREDTGHAFYDAYVLRAYEAHLGPTRVQMQRLINTGLYVINLGSNRFSGYVNGVVNQYRPERKYLNYQWIELSVLDRRLYDVAGQAVLASHEYYDNVPVEAAILYAKHYWAAARPEPEVPDDAKGVAPGPGSLRAPGRMLPPAAIMGLVWGASELLLALRNRFRPKPPLLGRRSSGLIWLVTAAAVVLGFIAAHRLPACEMARRQFSRQAGSCLFVPGLALRWYAALHLRRFLGAKLAGAADPGAIGFDPYRYIRYPGYTGSLLAAFGFSLSFHNWASLLIIFVPCCAVALWSLRLEEVAPTGNLGEPWRGYRRRTKRLISLIY